MSQREAPTAGAAGHDGTWAFVTVAAIGLMLTLAADGFIAWSTYSALSKVPPGSTVRPLGLAPLVLLAFATLAVQAVVAVCWLGFGWNRWWNWLLAAGMIACGFTPFWVLKLTVRWVAASRGLQFD